MKWDCKSEGKMRKGKCEGIGGIGLVIRMQSNGLIGGEGDEVFERGIVGSLGKSCGS